MKKSRTTRLDLKLDPGVSWEFFNAWNLLPKAKRAAGILLTLSDFSLISKKNHCWPSTGGAGCMCQWWTIVYLVYIHADCVSLFTIEPSRTRSFFLGNPGKTVQPLSVTNVVIGESQVPGCTSFCDARILLLANGWCKGGSNRTKRGLGSAIGSALVAQVVALENAVASKRGDGFGSVVSAAAVPSEKDNTLCFRLDVNTIRQWLRVCLSFN